MVERSFIGDSSVILKFGNVVYEMTLRKFWNSMTPWIAEIDDMQQINFESIPSTNILSEIQIYGADGFVDLKRLTKLKNDGEFTALETVNGNVAIIASGNSIKTTEGLLDIEASNFDDASLVEKMPIYSNFTLIMDIDPNIAYAVGYVSNAFNADRITHSTKIEFITKDEESDNIQMRNTEFKKHVLDAFKHQGIKQNPTNICVPKSKLAKIFKLLSVDEDILTDEAAEAEAPPTILSWHIPSKIAYLCGVFDACASSFIGNSIMVVAPSYKMQNQLYDVARSLGISCKKQTIIDEESNKTKFSLLVRLDFDLDLWSSNLFKKMWDESYVIRTMRDNSTKEEAISENSMKMCKTIGQIENGGKIVKKMIIEETGDDDMLEILCYAEGETYGVETESGEFYADGLIR